YESIFDPHLREPRIAQVFTYSPGQLLDPLTTHKSSAAGPFVFPQGAAWPVCGFCQARMAFLGVLDFREYRAVPVPRGSLALHVCNECGACADRETWSLTWIKEDQPIEIRGDGD